MVALMAVAPVMILIGLGQAVRGLGLLDPKSLRNVNALLYWICLPALLFHKVQGLTFELAQVAPFFAALTLGTLASITFTGLLSVILRLPGSQRAALMQAGFRGNLAFVGLPVALFYLQARGLGTPDLEAKIFLALAPGIILYNVLGVVLLSSANLTFSKAAWRAFTWQVLSNPLILSVLAGLAWGAWGPELGQVATKVLEVLSGAVLPLALMGVGASADLTKLKGSGFLPWVAAGTKCILTPLFGYGFALWLGLSLEETRILVILMIAPTATAAFILAEQMGGDAQMTARSVVFSVLVSLAAYLVALSLL